MTIDSLHGYIFFDLKVKCFPYSRNFWLTLRLSFPHASKCLDLILVENIYLINWIISCLRKDITILIPIYITTKWIVERKNHYLLDVTLTLLIESFVPSKYCVESLFTIVYLINRLPPEVLNLESPYYCLFHKHPIYHSFHTFEFICLVHLPPFQCN